MVALHPSEHGASLPYTGIFCATLSFRMMQTLTLFPPQNEPSPSILLDRELANRFDTNVFVYNHRLSAKARICFNFKGSLEISSLSPLSTTQPEIHHFSLLIVFVDFYMSSNGILKKKVKSCFELHPQS